MREPSGSLRSDGKLDQVRIYSSALDSTDVEKLYKESADVPTANLVAHYKLDGNATDETETYDGTASNVTYSAGVYGGTPTNVNFLGMAFQPDLVWFKNRTGAYLHQIYDSIRGVDKCLNTGAGGVGSRTGAEAEFDDGGNDLMSFDNNGFTIGASALGSVNENGFQHVAWCWKAGGSVTPNNNTDGTITSTVSANQDAGFSIVKINSATGTSADTIGHGLSQAPEMIFYKTTNTTGNWAVYHSALGNTKGVYLNLTSAAVTSQYFWNNTSPTSSVFTAWGSQGNSHIAYCFHSVDGYQKVGYFNQLSGTTTVSTGFEPRFLIIKRTDSTGDWIIFDNLRNNGDAALYANSSIQEQDTTGYTMAFNNDGFVLTVAAGSYDVDYIYLAIA
jgi:hypothetical protein